MARTCNTTCVKCGKRFDRFSGLLLNLSDKVLGEFYNIQVVKEALKEHKHTTLCVDCLYEELGRKFRADDCKFKQGRWMTSNVAVIAHYKYGDSSKFHEVIEKLRADDDHGLLPFKMTEVKALFDKYLC